MKPIGRALGALCVFLLAVSPGGSWAALSAGLDRQSAAMGDTLRLTIIATNDEKLERLDLGPLSADFEILQRTNKSNTNYTNGQFSNTRELLLDITPRREGSLAVPSLRLDQQVTSAIPVRVSPAPKGSGDNQNILFEAELDRSSVYVQGQVILTLRLQQAINLDDRSITDLQLDNAFVRPLEQNSFQRTVEGRPWLVHEVRYAIFPEQSGTLVIPSQTFSARASTARRSLFDIRGAGRQLRRTTEPLSVEVQPRPNNFPATEWLPARALTLHETWSTPPEDLKVGESATRTITIRGEGLQGAQLPPVMYPPAQGLKYYPDQPAIGDDESASGLVGSRVDSVAVVPTQAGRWVIPELRIPWWDTRDDELRYAVLPARELEVAAGSSVLPAPLPNPIPAASTTLTADSAAPIPLVAADNSRLWQIVGAVNGVGWLLTLLYIAWTRGRKNPTETQSLENPQDNSSFKTLLQACAGSKAQQARGSVIAWTAALTARSDLASLAQVSDVFGDPALEAALVTLNAALYGSDQSSWDGSELAEAAKRLRSQHRKATVEDSALQLYPQGI
jgi:hypothetical protein